ncbi:MAG: hypothetical protein VYC39_01075 [Myxococcota bacterium]|nr:hypothetical protein [Myxococcota bacterium]
MHRETKGASNQTTNGRTEGERAAEETTKNNPGDQEEVVHRETRSASNQTTKGQTGQTGRTVIVHMISAQSRMTLLNQKRKQRPQKSKKLERSSVHVWRAGLHVRLAANPTQSILCLKKAEQSFVDNALTKNTTFMIPIEMTIPNTNTTVLLAA